MFSSKKRFASKILPVWGAGPGPGPVHGDVMQVGCGGAVVEGSRASQIVFGTGRGARGGTRWRGRG